MVQVINGKPVSRFVLLLVLAHCLAAAANAQRCPPPPVLLAPPSVNIFTPQQEVDLGDIAAEQIERRVHVIHDDQLSAHLNQIVASLLAQLPPTNLNFRVTLIDLPVVNAFSLPGGRIYVARKLIAFAHSDQELADLLGHEMGHVLSHQGAIDTTFNFRELLGVTSVGDRKDIFDKYNRFMDNVARDPKVLERARSEEEPHQYQADEVALYALANAGYSPQSFAEFFDRLAQTKGNTGGLLSDLFGHTTPSEKRLREIHKSIDAMPAACRVQSPSKGSDEFLSWQSDVIAYSGFGRREDLSGLIDKKLLNPPLRNDATNIRFSPDGKYVLAQDDSSIFVLSRDPLRLLFRIDSPDAHAAQFTSDSQNIVFDTPGLRVEEWNVIDQERTGVHDVAVAEGCSQSKLSPDGKTLACLDRGFGISLYDVAQGDQIFSKKGFFFTNALEMYFIELQILVEAEAGIHVEWVHLGFSTDSKKFLAASPRNAIAIDLATHEQISLHGSLPEMAGIGFAFLDADRVAAMNRDIKDSAILKFPSGEVLQRLPLGGQRLQPATHGGYVMVGPLKDYVTGVLDLSSNKFVFGSKDNYAVDAYDRMLVMQARNGEIFLYNLDSAKIESHTAISLSPLGPLRASAMSTDLKWLALSGTTRGAVWDLSTAERLYYTRGFHGAYFDGDAALYADYPKFDPQDRSIARLDLAGRGSQTEIKLGDDSRVRQWGNVLVTRKPAGKGGGYYRNATIDVSDIHGGNPLWSRTFSKEVPSMTWSPAFGTVLIGWPVDDDAAKDEFKTHPVLQTRLNAMRDRKTAWLMEAMDARTGKETGALLVDTGKGSFHIEYGYAAGEWIVIVDTDGRTRLYSLSTGEQKGSAFGTRSALSSEAGLLTVESQPGQIDIYELSSMQKRGQLTFASPISLWKFSADGKRMLALSQQQIVFTFDTSRMGIKEDTAPTASTTAPGK
jgi:WD40 repeat protein